MAAWPCRPARSAAGTSPAGAAASSRSAAIWRGPRRRPVAGSPFASAVVDVAAGRREADPALVPRARPGAAQRPLQADPAGRGHRPQAAQQPGPSVGAGQVADRARAAFELRQQVRVGRVVRHARRRARTGGRRRELGDEVEPFEQARRQHRPEDEGRRRQIVAGDPARQPEGQERQERTVRPDPVGDRLGRDRRRRRRLGEDDAEGLPAPELDEHGLAGHEIRQGGRDEVGERPVAAASGRVDGDLDRTQPGRAVPGLAAVAARRLDRRARRARATRRAASRRRASR